MQTADSKKNEQWLKKSALHYLGQRSSSTANLKRVLTRRARRRIEGEDADASTSIPGLVETVVAFCVEHGFVNDDVYAETKASNATRAGMSQRKMAAKLASKGIARDVIGTAVAVIDDEAAAIAFARRRRLGAWKSDQSKRDLDKDVAALARAGFSLTIAIRTARMTAEEAQDHIC